MSSDHPKQGLFSSLSLGRASRPAKATTSDQPLAHPLLGASTSSLNINEPSGSSSHSNSASASDHHATAPSHSRQNSASGSRNVSTTTDILNVPYKPRQRGSHTQGAGSVSSISSTTGIHTATSPSFPPTVTTSPVTPTAAPTTSTSTSTTFALPPSATATTETAFAVDAMAPAVAGSSSTSSASATSRLQLQSLKAAAQKLGLGNGSMGMQLVDTVFEKSQAGRGKAEGVEWVELLKLVSAGKAVLLLPTTPVSSLPITTQVLRDHVAFLSSSIPQSASASRVDATSIYSEGSGGSTTTVVTLSGLVGTLRGSTVIFESTLSTDSSLFAAIRDPITRTATLSALRPTTLPSATQPFPSFTLSTETTLLPFPPLNRSTTPIGGHETRDQHKATGGKLGRINPFMSLFGGSQAASPALGTSPAAQSDSSPSSPSKASFGTLSPERPRSPVHAASPSQLLTSPRPASIATLMTDQGDTASIRSDITSRDRDPEGYQILAYTISKPISAGDIGKSVHKSLKTSIREELHRLPDKVIEKVFKLVVAGACPTYSPSTDKPDPSLTLDYADPTVTGEKLQEVLEGVYDDLILHFRADSSHLFAENSEYSSIRRKASWTRKGMPADMLGDKAENESEGAKRERKEKLRREKEAMVEREATDGTERVEAVVCRLLYNRLFSPLESDDSRHDEALSSRIAALNMLDLSLDHLGLITRPEDAPPEEDGLVARGLADIVDRIGDELQKLSTPSCLTPREKGDVLIQAHKLVVDGLAELPPIDLRPEGEQYKPPSRSPSPSPDANSAVDQTASPQVPKVSSTSSSANAPPTAPSAALAMRRSSSSGSTPLSTSPASNDPLSSIAEVTERTPQGLQATSPTEVPQLVLPDSNDEASQIEEAMSDSVITLPARDSKPAAAEKDQVKASMEKTAPRKQTTSGADLILPIIIFAVVKSNPPQLASQLMYLRRYRSAICLTGEASYAIVNLTAVVEFLEHVELSQLGLGDESDKVISVEDLSPIGLNYLDETNADAASIASASSRLRGRVFQVGELAGSAADSANKVLTGVVDSSWTALRGLISTPNPNAPDEDASVPPPTDSRPGMRPRQASSFSLASVTASVATIAAAAASRSRSRANSRASAIMSQPKEEHTWKGNEEMVEVVSRPESVRERDRQSIYPSDDEDEQSGDDDRDGADVQATGVLGRHERSKSDTRSIYSVASAMSRVKSRDADSIKESSRKDADREREREDARERVSISDRLASIGVLGRIGGQETPGREAGAGDSPQGKHGAGLLAGIASSARSASASGSGHARRLSLLSGRPDASPSGSNASLPTVSPASGPTAVGSDIEPPIEQFMTCDVGDIKLSEIGVLLRDYRRLGGIVNALKGRGAGAATGLQDTAT